MKNNFIKKSSVAGSTVRILSEVLDDINPSTVSGGATELARILNVRGISDISKAFKEISVPGAGGLDPRLFSKADDLFGKLLGVSPELARSARTSTATRTVNDFARQLRTQFPAERGMVGSGVDALTDAAGRIGRRTVDTVSDTAGAIGRAGRDAASSVASGGARVARNTGSKLYEAVAATGRLAGRSILGAPGMVWRAGRTIFKITLAGGLAYGAYRWYNSDGEAIDISYLKQLLKDTRDASGKFNFVSGAVSKGLVDELSLTIDTSLATVDYLGKKDSSEENIEAAIRDIIIVSNADTAVLDSYNNEVFGGELATEDDAQPAAQFLALCSELLNEIKRVIGELERLSGGSDSEDAEGMGGRGSGRGGFGESGSEDPDGPGPLRAPWSDPIYLFDKPFDISNITPDFRDALFGMLDKVIGTPEGLAYLDPQGGQGIFGDNHIRAINYLYLRGVGSGRQVGKEADRQLGRSERRGRMGRKSSSEYWRRVSRYKNSLGRWRKKIFRDMKEYVDNLRTQREDAAAEMDSSGYGYDSGSDYGYEEGSDYGYEDYNKDGHLEVKKSSSNKKIEQSFEKNKNFTQNFSKPANYKTSDVIYDMGSRFNMQKKADKFSKQYYRDAVSDLEDQYAKSYYAGLRSMYDKKQKKTKADYSKLYELHDETGPELIGSAHPQTIDIADAMGNGGIVENQVEQQRANIGVAKSMPSGNFTGRHAWVIHNLVKLAERADEMGDLESSDLIDAALEELKKL